MVTRLLSFFWLFFFGQASPSDPENFPFVVLGNKVDVDSGNSRVVSDQFGVIFPCLGQMLTTQKQEHL
jgi:hypothetical protein